MSRSGRRSAAAVEKSRSSRGENGDYKVIGLLRVYIIRIKDKSRLEELVKIKE